MSDRSQLSALWALSVDGASVNPNRRPIPFDASSGFKMQRAGRDVVDISPGSLRGYDNMRICSAIAAPKMTALNVGDFAAAMFQYSPQVAPKHHKSRAMTVSLLSL